MTKVEFESSEDAKKNLRLEKQNVTGKVQDNCNGPWNEKISFLNT